MAVNVRQNVLFTDPKTFVERTSVAESCVRKLGIHIPALVDDVSDAVEAAYTGWPDRLYLIDREGRVVAGYIGPAEWDRPEVIETIRRYLPPHP